MCMFCRSLFVIFLVAIVLSVLRFTDSDYPFGILKFFLTPSHFNEVSVPSQESERSCIYVLRLTILYLSTILLLDFRTVHTV
jgi:hypothetical protein